MTEVPSGYICWSPPTLDAEGNACLPAQAVPSKLGLLTEYVGRGLHSRWGLVVGRVVRQHGRLVLFAAAGDDRVVKMAFPAFQGLEVLVSTDSSCLNVGWVPCWNDLPSTAVQGGWDSVSGKALYIGRSIPGARYCHVGSILDRSGRLLMNLGGAALEQTQFQVLCFLNRQLFVH